MDEEERRAELERLIDELPRGYLSVKMIRGKERYYHQWYEDGKLVTKYVRAADYPPLKEQMDRKRLLKSELRELEDRSSTVPLRTDALVGKELLAMAEKADGYRRRDCYRILDGYLHGNDGNVCILHGLRRTGKTMLICQALADMGDEELERTAYILVGDGDTNDDIRTDLRHLRARGIRTVFIDEVTRLRNFVPFSYYFADVIVMSGMRVVLSGTDSLGFWAAAQDQLYGKAVFIHTTYIPYREHARLTGGEDIDGYITHGGIFRGGSFDLEGPASFRECPSFDTDEDVDRYMGLAITGNIENTLVRTVGCARMSFGNDAFQMHEAGVFRDAIARIVEDINRRFLPEIVKADSRSGDPDNLVHNIDQCSGDPPWDVEGISRDDVSEALRRVLDITEAGDGRPRITGVTLLRMKTYLKAMDLFADMPTESENVDEDRSEHTICLQPGLRYRQAMATIDALEADDMFRELPVETREAVKGLARDTVSGHILEEMVLYDTMTSLGAGFRVFKLFMDQGEVDMVIRDLSAGECVLVEVKRSTTPHQNQSRHMRDGHTLEYMSHRFGKVVAPCVLYRGEDTVDGRGVRYVNVRDYLLGLPESAEALFGRS